jgi:transcriptional regulator with XRE-family HTH domain
MSYNKNIAKNIKLLRLSKELTIKDFAEKVSIGAGIYGFYETERANVPLDNLIKIANFILKQNQDIEELLSKDR